jgi:O-6-methylguanine DNA methyltransferase
MTVFAHVAPSPVGDLLIAVEPGGALVAIEYLNRRTLDETLALVTRRGDTVEWNEAACQPILTELAEYFRGERTEFSLALAPRGTEFERAVWRQLQDIPFGETRSYRDIAQALGRPTAVRAVGRANGANPISIVVPCHRVIGADGSLTGYGGGLPVKERLLGLEQGRQGP